MRQFIAKTTDAFCIKTIADILHMSLKTVCLEIDAAGIFISMIDTESTVMFKIELVAHNFIVYKFLFPEKLHIGINTVHFFRMLKNIKKKDTLTMYIDPDIHPDQLAFEVIPKGNIDNNRIMTSFIAMHAVQNVKITVPELTTRPIIVQSTEYQKIIKELCSMSFAVHIQAWEYGIQFSCDTASVMKRIVYFGEPRESNAVSIPPLYDDTFYTESIAKTPKICNLGTNIQIFPDNPLTFKSRVGTLGELTIYIKTKTQIDNKNKKQL